MAETSHLLDAARSGDRGALEVLFARHRGRLSAFLRGRMSPALARRVPPEDVLQETLLEASRKLHAFEPRGPGSFYGWLVAIARRKVLEAARGRAEEGLPESDPLHEAAGAAAGRPRRTQEIVSAWPCSRSPIESRKSAARWDHASASG